MSVNVAKKGVSLVDPIIKIILIGELYSIFARHPSRQSSENPTVWAISPPQSILQIPSHALIPCDDNITLSHLYRMRLDIPMRHRHCIHWRLLPKTNHFNRRRRGWLQSPRIIIPLPGRRCRAEDGAAAGGRRSSLAFAFAVGTYAGFDLGD